MRHLESPSHDPQYLEMAWDQWSWSELDSTAAIESQFRISRNRHSCCIVYLPLHVAIPETLTRTRINGPDQILIWRLKLHRDFTYRDIRIPDVNNFWHVQLSIPKTPTRTGINSPDLILIQRLRFKSRFCISQNRDSCCIVSLTFPTCDPWNSEVVSICWRHTWIDTCWILPRVTLIRDLHVPEMLNQSDTCHYLVVPRVPS